MDSNDFNTVFVYKTIDSLNVAHLFFHHFRYRWGISRPQSHIHAEHILSVTISTKRVSGNGNLCKLFQFILFGI